MSKSYYSIKKYFFITNLKNKLKRMITKCRTCQLQKHHALDVYETQGRYCAKFPNDKISIDIKGPIKTCYFETDRDHHLFYIIVMTDSFSRFTQVAVVFSIKSKKIINIIQKAWIGKYSSPGTILTDQERQFISQEFKDLCTVHNIKHILTTVYNPECNEIVDRVNKIIGKILRINKGSPLSTIGDKIQLRLNEPVHRSTREIPFTGKATGKDISQEK